MKKIITDFEYNLYENIDELDEADRNLIRISEEAAKNAHAPYSNFRVGTALLLENGEILAGNNQENASYPVGICAERTLLSYVHANYPDQLKKKLAISVLDSDHIVSPCGLCRQTLLEYEMLQNQPIEIILHNRIGSVLVIPSAASLLPLFFDGKSLT